MKNTIYKILCVIVLACMLYSPISPVFETRKATAVWGVSDFSWAFEVSPTAIASFVQIVKEYALKIAGQILKKAILDQVTQQIINWINNDGKGVVVDWDIVLQNASAVAFDSVIKDIGLGFLCSPFNLQLQMVVAKPPTFTHQITCSPALIERNLKNFYADFRRGDWITYQEIWLPKNNFYGATILALDETARRQAAAEDTTRSENTANGGYLSVKKCDKDPTTGKESCRTMTPGNYIGEAAKTATLFTPLNAIIGADDTAAYISAIMDAAINRFVIKNGVSYIKELLAGPVETQQPTTGGPCANLPAGEAKTACENLEKINNSNVEDARRLVLDTISTVLDTRRTASTTLMDLIDSQQDLTNTLFALADCQTGSTASSTQSQAEAEQITLDHLLAEFETNKEKLDPLEKIYSKAVAAEDVTTLALLLSEAQPLTKGDQVSEAGTFLKTVQAEEDSIQENINETLYPAKRELAKCPSSGLPPTTEQPKTPKSPVFTTASTTNITANSATLNASVSPNGNYSYARFEYGTTNLLGKVTSYQTTGNGTTTVSITANITGLTASTTYYYRIMGTNSIYGLIYGSISNFFTK